MRAKFKVYMLSFLKNLFTTYLEYDILLYYKLFLHSSMVESSAVNRVVVGSSPTVGVHTRVCKMLLVT